MGLGFASAYGAKAANDTLLDIMARNALAQKEAFNQRMQVNEQNAALANADRDYSLRRDQFNATKDYNDRTLASLDADRKASQDRDRAAADKDRATTAAVAQRKAAAEAYVKDASQPPKLRQAVQYYLTTGQDVPSAFFQEPDQAVSNALAIDSVKRQRDKADDATKATMDNPKAPRGVQDYVLQLRSRHGDDYLGAQRELAGAWNQIKAAHPNVDAAEINKIMRQAFARQGGAQGVKKDNPLAGLDLSVLDQ